MLAAKFCNYRGYPRWRVSTFLNGRRKQRYFKTLAQANQWIQELKSTGCVASFWAALSSQEQLDLVGAYRIAQQRSICLLEAAKLFPDDDMIQYNLACYCAQLGQLDAAQEHLDKSYELGDAKQIKLMALDDDDLKPLWEGEGAGF